MNERLPYEDDLSEKLSDLNLPDENMAWADMKRRLDEDTDKPLAPFLPKGCMGYGIFAALLIALLWIGYKSSWFSKESSKEKKEQPNSSLVGKKGTFTQRNTDVSIHKNDNTTYSADSLKNIKSTGNSSISDKFNSSDSGRTQFPGEQSTLKENSNKLHFSKKGVPQRIKINTSNTLEESKKTRKQNIGQKGRNAKTRTIKRTIPGSDKVTISGNDTDKNSEDSTFTTKATDTPVVTTIPKKESSIIKKQTDTTKKELKNTDSTSKKTKKISEVYQEIYFAAGLGEQQEIPINGQQSLNYNSLGRKTTLRDYIPAIHFRMYKGQKWFIDAGFRYGAPQYTKEIEYIDRKVNVIDTSGGSNINTTTSTTNKLKKTYYHQLPVTFNYFVYKGLAVGAGFTWNVFSSALVQRDVHQFDNIAQIDSLLSSALITTQKADSNFVKSYFQMVTQLQYYWKRVSLGIKYSFGLQPYLRYQLPDGIKREEKNSSLQIFIKYDLWQSKKKKK